MKLLFISNLYPPGVVGGYEVLCHQIASALATRGHAIHVLTSDYGVSGSGSKTDTAPGHRVERLLTLLATRGNVYQPLDCSDSERRKINERNCLVTERTIRSVAPDVIFVWNLHFLDRSLLDAIRRFSAQTVFLLTDIWLISLLNADFVNRYYQNVLHGITGPGWWSRALHRLAYYRVHGKAIYSSNFMWKLYQQAGIRFDGSIVIHNGAVLDEVRGLPPAERAVLRKSGELRLLFAGRVVHVKGVHTLIEALPEVIQRLPDLNVQLTILGDVQDQDYLRHLQRQIESGNLASYVHFESAVSESELSAVFNLYDVYVFPSLHEPFSLTLLHALASGIPTVSSDAGGNPEIVIHRNTGMLFPKGDASRLAEAVVDLARDGQLRQVVSRAASLHANTYTLDYMAQQVESYLVVA
jgi:glycosyltransferase involved in cell wall biosynthesis